MDDAFRLLLHHATTISFDSVLIHNSALFTLATKFQPSVIEVKRNGRYDLGDSSPASQFSAHSELVSAVMPMFKLCLPVASWFPNSQHIAVYRVNWIEILDAQSGSIVDSFDISPSSLDPQQVLYRCLAFFPDNSKVAYVTRGDMHVRNTLAGKEEFVVTGHGEGLASINVSPNGKLLVSGSKSGRIQVCNAENGALVWNVDTDTKLRSTSISPNSRFIVTLSFSLNYGVRIWNANDGSSYSIIPHDVISVLFSPDSNELASIDREGVVRVWGMSQMTMELIQEWYIGPQPTCLVFSPNGRQLAAAKGENVYILRGDNNYVAKLNRHSRPVTSWAFSADGVTLASGSLDMTIQLAAAMGENVYTLRRDNDYVTKLNGHARPVTSLAFSADGLTLASGSLDMTIRVWDASSTRSSGFGVEKEKQLMPQWDSVIWSPRCQSVMAYKDGSRERKAWICRTQGGTYGVWEDISHDFPPGYCVAISDCGQYLAGYSGSYSSLRSITTRRITSGVRQSNTRDVVSADWDPNRYKFFPNSTRFAATSGHFIYTWDASVSRSGITSLVGHSSTVDELHFAPDCSRLLSRAGEEIFAWNVDNLQLVSRIGNVIYRPHKIETTEDDWVVMILPDHGGRRRLFRLPSEYQPYEIWSTSESWMSKCILIRRVNGNALIVEFSALLAGMIDCTN